MTSLTAVRQHFIRQAAACEALGSPLTAGVLHALAGLLDGPAIPAWATPLAGWQGDPAADALALRVAGALHRIVLDGDAELAVAYASHRIDAGLIDAAFARNMPLLLQYLQTPPQTNDPLRSAVLLGGFITVAAATGKPLALREIGASAGLNQLWQCYAYDFGSWSYGDPMAAPLLLRSEWQGNHPQEIRINVRDSRGCDLRPLDPRDPEQRKRLLSYIWADQWPRLERVATALEHAGRSSMPPERISAGDFVARELAQHQAGTTFVLYHSIVWQYVDAAERQRIIALMNAAGETASDAAPVAWLRFEPGSSRDGADLDLTLWPGGHSRRLAVADYHGRWIRWEG